MNLLFGCPSILRASRCAALFMIAASGACRPILRWDDSLRTASVQGRVVDPHGTPVLDADVRLVELSAPELLADPVSPPDSGHDLREYVSPDAQGSRVEQWEPSKFLGRSSSPHGQFVFSGLPQSTYRLEVAASRGARTRWFVDVPLGGVVELGTVTVFHPVRVEGRVIAQAGAAHQVACITDEDELDRASMYGQVAVTNEHGEFSFSAVRGRRLTIVVGRGRDGPVYVHHAELPLDGGVKHLRVHLSSDVRADSFTFRCALRPDQKWGFVWRPP